ncbi:MAG TPA: GNAT family N-acetyltransferase [Acidimicrobiia bacterium]|nr:GNAT family N-acetyltransferase [Acidimicrobiia bacterium]
MPIRDARIDDCDELSALAFASKAYWGYDDAFMEACRAELTVTPDDLGRASLRVAEQDGSILGFHAVDDREIVWFFVRPGRMGEGVGAALFADACAVARARGLTTLRIEADPNAAAFYERMGATRVGVAPSASIAGRALPLLAIDVSSTT